MNCPSKRWAAWAIFFDGEWKILLLEPTYKEDWEIPGGIIEENESPREACKREVLEELWLEKQVWELLCLEYQRESDDSYMFVFDGGVLSEEEIVNIKLQESEIKSFGFYSLEDVEDKFLKKMFVRIGKCVEAREKWEMVYYEMVYK